MVLGVWGKMGSLGRVYACNRLTNRLKYSAAVQVMDLSNSYDLILVRYSAAYPTGAERFFLSWR